MSPAPLHRRSREAREARRRRELITPEGLALPLTLASRGARGGALLLDLSLIVLFLVAMTVVLGLLGFGVIGTGTANGGAAVELILVLFLLLGFLARYGYFLWFELGPRGATPGKRALGIRVAARDGGRLTAEAVIARNLMRDAEVFVPLAFLVSGQTEGVSGVATGLWLAVFLFLPLFNRDALRAGDLVAGTWVIEADRRRLPEALSLIPRTAGVYRFGEAELSVYGEHELQVLEGVLRHDDPVAQRKVMEAICAKIGWEPGAGDERAFLEAFYEALRARLERDMRFGKRKKDKFDR